MSTDFPTSLDSLSNPQTSDPLNNPSHAGQHANANDAIEALEAKVGVTSSAVTTSLDYRVGKLETQTVNSQGDDYTAVLTDANKVIYFTNADGDAFTIPPNSSVAFPTGTRIDVVQAGDGTITLTPGSGVTINVNAALTLVTNGKWSGCTVLKVDTDVWVAFGDLVAA